MHYCINLLCAQFKFLSWWNYLGPEMLSGVKFEAPLSEVCFSHVFQGTIRWPKGIYSDDIPSWHIDMSRNRKASATQEALCRGNTQHL